jgi:hypothetical protein
MSEIQETQGTENNEMTFGVSADLKSKNLTPFNPGINKAALIEVKREEVGKDAEKYLVLSFTFKDLEGNRTHKHSEFTVSNTDADRDKKINGMNVRLKHIYEAFAPFPQAGLGVGAKSWEDFFDKVATSFNTGANGKPIFYREVEDKKVPIHVFIKVSYQGKKEKLGFPLSPNFIERAVEGQQSPKTIVIDKKYDKLEQSSNASVNTPVMGGGAIPPQNDFGF